MQHKHSNRPTEFSTGTNTVFLHASWIFKWLQNREKLCQLLLNIQKDHKIIQISQLNSLLGPKTEFYIKYGGHLEKWAPYWILKWLPNSKT